MFDGRTIISLVAERQDLDQFRKKNWTGSFEEYLDLIRQHPEITRNAFQRVYDMVMSYGTTVHEEFTAKSGCITAFLTIRTMKVTTPYSGSTRR